MSYSILDRFLVDEESKYEVFVREFVFLLHMQCGW